VIVADQLAQILGVEPRRRTGSARAKENRRSSRPDTNRKVTSELVSAA
jgi:hypothetical protein